MQGQGRPTEGISNEVSLECWIHLTREETSLTEIEEHVRALAKVGVCYSPSWSPDNETIAFISDLTGVPQVWTVPRAGGWPSLVTTFDDPIRGVLWSPTGDYLAFSLAPGGGMNQQIYLVHPDGSGLHRITAGEKDNNWLGSWARDGRSLGFSSNARNPDAMDSVLFDLRDGRTRSVFERGGTSGIVDVSHDGRYALISHRPYRSDSNLFLADTQDGAERLLTPHEGLGSFPSGKFSPDGKTVYLQTNKDREMEALGRVRIDDGMVGPIEILAERSDAELYEFELSEDGRTAALFWNVGGLSELSFLDLQTMAAVSGSVLPAERAFMSSFSHGDGRFLALTVTGSTIPFDVWVLDRASGALSRITRSPHPGVDLGSLVKPRLVHFKAHDGLDLSGWLYMPTGTTGGLPVVLSFHGGPEGQEVPYFSFTYQALLSQGIAVFAPNVRGSTGFGKTFVNSDNGAKRFDAIKDIKACVDCVVRSGIANQKRIGIMGGSYGGYMTMAGLTEYPELFAAGVDEFGIVNFETFFSHTEPWMAAISKVEYGDPETEKELLRSLSPIQKIDRVVAPTLVLHGANDTNVPVVEAEQVAEGLKKKGVPVEFVLFPDEGHGFSKIGNRIRTAVLEVEWFKRYLGSNAP